MEKNAEKQHKVTTIAHWVLDIIIIGMIVWAVGTGYWYIILCIAILYSIYVVWRGWYMIKNLLFMIDIVYNKYRLTKERRKNGKLKTK